MKKIITLIAIVTSVFAVSFEHMSNDDMMNMRGNVPSNQQADFQKEMQKRMKSMSPQEQQMFKKNNKNMMQGQGNMNNQNMMQGQGNMNNQNMMNSQRFEHMSTDDMMNMRGNVPSNQQADFQKEMQKRMKSMSPQEQQMFKKNNKNMMRGQGNMMNN